MAKLTIYQTRLFIEVLGIKETKKGYWKNTYKTAWGNKTLEGLRETIENIINDPEPGAIA